MSTELRRVFESIIHTAERISTHGITEGLLSLIIAQAERGISLITHIPNEPDLPEWENHDKPKWMVEIGVEGDRLEIEVSER